MSETREQNGQGWAEPPEEISSVDLITANERERERMRRQSYPTDCMYCREPIHHTNPTPVCASCFPRWERDGKPQRKEANA